MTPRMQVLPETEMLSPVKAKQIAEALIRLGQLSTQKILTKDTEAEKIALERFLQPAAMQHLNELLGCWAAVREEYEPMIRAFGVLLGRSAVFADHLNSARNEKSKPEPETTNIRGDQPANVVPLPQEVKS